MKKFHAPILIIVLALTSGAFGQPKLTATPEKFDFGYTVKDAAITTNFWLKSHGTDTVVITDIQTGCVCTTIPLKTDRIAPGDSLDIYIRWETARTFGAVERHPRIYYKNAKDPLRIAMNVNVMTVPDSTVMPLSVWPFKFELSRLESISIDSISFKIKNVLDRTIKVSLANLVPEQCELVIPDLIPPLGEGWGYIKVKPDYIDKEFDSSITLKFSHDEKFLLTVPIRRKNYSGQSE